MARCRYSTKDKRPKTTDQTLQTLAQPTDRRPKDPVAQQVDWHAGSECLWRRLRWFAEAVRAADAGRHPVGTVLAGLAPAKARRRRKGAARVELRFGGVLGSPQILRSRLLPNFSSKSYS